MPNRSAPRLLPCVLACALFAACGEPDVEYAYAPFTGDAFPNQRKGLVLPSGEVGFTSDNGSDTVTVLALPTGQVLAQVPIGRNPVDLDGPHHLAVDRAGGAVYVALSYPAPVILPGPHAAHGASLADGFVQKLALSDLRPLGEVRVDNNPGDIVLSDDGKRLIVSHFDLALATQPGLGVAARRARLAVIDPAQFEAEPRRVTLCVAPHGLALSRPDGRFAYAACYGEDALAVVDLGVQPAAVKRIALGPKASDTGSPNYGPYAVALSPSGKSVAVSSTGSRDVRLYDVQLGAFGGPVLATAGAPYFAAWSKDGARLWVPTQKPDALVEIEVATGTTLRSRNLGAACVRPHEVLRGAGGQLYVVCEGDHVAPGHVLVVDPVTLQPGVAVPVGVYPDRLVVMPGS